jgi:alpha-galactosidase
VGTPNLSATVTRKAGPVDLRLWQVTLANGGNSAAGQTLLNSFTIVPNTGNHGCRVSVLLPVPLPVGPIAPSATRSVEVPISFAPGCGKSDTFSVQAVFSAGNGSDVGTLALTDETE